METNKMINTMMKSMIDTDRAPVVICNTEHTIVYMNPAAIKQYAKQGGEKLLGKCLLHCHNPQSNEMIKKIVDWFSENSDNQMIYTNRNDAKNRDVYMVALRDDSGKLIGYYEKHEYRASETAGLYDFSKSLI